MTRVIIEIRAANATDELYLATWVEESLRELHDKGGLIYDHLTRDGEPIDHSKIKVEFSTDPDSELEKVKHRLREEMVDYDEHCKKLAERFEATDVDGLALELQLTCEAWSAKEAKENWRSKL